MWIKRYHNEMVNVDSLATIWQENNVLWSRSHGSVGKVELANVRTAPLAQALLDAIAEWLDKPYLFMCTKAGKHGVSDDWYERRHEVFDIPKWLEKHHAKTIDNEKD